MKTPFFVPLAEMDWTPHPMVVGVESRFFPNPANHAPQDVMIARIDVGGNIPWHVHAEHVEVAYILRGQAICYFAESNFAENPDQERGEHPIQAGHSLIIPAGVWHSVVNIGEEPFEAFAVHTP